jgi:hypothetical protein
MEKSIQDICLGIFILLLSLVIWRLTHNALGWVVLFLPGGNGSFTSTPATPERPLGGQESAQCGPPPGSTRCPRPGPRDRGRSDM